MADKEYIERLQMVIRQLHNCDAVHLASEPITGVFRDQTVWDGVVGVFTVTRPRAKKAYAWSENQGEPNEKSTAVLGLPTVASALDAVKASIVTASREGA